MTEKLKAYRGKRNFAHTSEPTGGRPSNESGQTYVMHMHAASHDHFDLRLEQDGVLRSWALPKGPSLEAGEKRLAVEVEAHPLEYGDFEGVIPKGQYGGGTSMLWDRGSWTPSGKLKADKLDFELHGKKLKGRWTLVKTAGKTSARAKKQNNWLLIKRTDSGPPNSAPDNLSVVSGRTMEEIARGEEPGPRTNPVPAAEALEKAQKKSMPASMAPQLASLVDSAPEGDTWIHEVKFDGYRLLARLAKGKVRLFTRNGKDWTHRFPALARTLAGLPVRNALLDGEIASFEQDGSTSFRKLQDTLGSSKRPDRTDQLVYQVFDLIYLNDYDLQSVALLERKKALAELLKAGADMGELVRYSDHLVGQGPDFFEQACELALEGIISKDIGASYRSGRQRSWLKTKCTLQDEFVVGGFTRPSGARAGFGSLLLGVFQTNQLVYVGRVGSGFGERQLRELHQRLKKIQSSTSPFVGEVPEQAGVQWVKPELIVDVEYTERTQSGALRHPVYRGLREDKDPPEVKLSESAGLQKHREAESGKASRPARSGRASDPVVAGVQLTHADRILYPEQGVTKLDLARYYEDIQDWIMPHLMNRPLSLLRCPSGRGEECFFQKHPSATFAKEIPRIAIEEKRGTRSDFVYVARVGDLIALAQFGVLELHPWGSVIADVEAPETLILDLDPGPEVSWGQIARAAFSLNERLLALGLNSFLQATGGKGLHLVVPIEPSLSWDELKAFAHALARAHARDDPKAFTTNMAKSKRGGKVFIDYLRNGRGNTSIARYSVRARPQAPVATPLRWDELTTSANANRYTINNIRRRLSALKADPWVDYEQARTRVTKTMRAQVGME